ncbi:hypothetical protein SAMN05518672_102808 [Chitinophaga sp. CF118]|uniref:hypothetical protein n=1 Tax=Chitinophaga sp. CF118 TaxID=1884367 RepID=UPI0008F24528|nr:hypothetical protein [Chitinophaga sp. CF118]SFD65387.1 hypothetical protein SAMN05518672_102808 [Chitinophaga sp. CF118]
MSPDYNHLLDRCRYVNEISASLIDNFLVYYAARQDKVEREFETRISRFREIEREMPSSWKGLIKSQYIAHRVFKERGLIRKYLNSAAIKARNAEEQEFLRTMATYPWRFSFSEIRSSPASDFYEMEDVFTGEVFLLYSPSITRILSTHSVLLWFNLIGYNGSCWQTYGPVTTFQGFNSDDIFFYATELNPAIESETDMMADLDDNPVRYMVLACGSNYPLVVQQEYEVVQVTGEGTAIGFDVQALKKDFRIEYAEQVFKLSHEIWSNPPHFAEAYYEEETGKTLLFALTDRGYREVFVILNAYGMEVPAEPDIRLHIPMGIVIKKALKRTLDLNPYSRLFEIETSKESQEELSKLNLFMELALPYINSGQSPDLAELAKQAGVDPELAGELFQNAMNSISKMRK